MTEISAHHYAEGMVSQAQSPQHTDSPLITQLRGGLIVSCQALPGEPLHSKSGGVMPLLAQAAVRGGAVAIRANGARDVREIKAAVTVPVIGLIKQAYPPYDPYITPTQHEVNKLIEAGADIVALDCTASLRPDGLTGPEFMARLVADHPAQLFMADIATFEEGMAAAAAGAYLVSTTLSGYTGDGPTPEAPDTDLVAQLAQHCPVPVVAEGRIHYPRQACAMLQAGAWCVVVGGAITRPQEITARFTSALAQCQPH